MASYIGKVLTSLAVVLAFSAAYFPGQASAQFLPIDSSRPASGIVNATNKHRRAHGIAPVVANEHLMRAAQKYAEYLARTGKSGHSADGRSLAQRIAASGYTACVRAENLYEDKYWYVGDSIDLRGIPDRAMLYWEPRPEHEKHLDNARLEHIGVGVASWAENWMVRTWIVQVLAGDCGSAPAPAPSACKAGFEPRFARATDRVCVTPLSRALASLENGEAVQRVQLGGGAYGPNTCKAGFVWREAFAGDLVCVTPERRTAVKQENQLAASRTL